MATAGSDKTKGKEVLLPVRVQPRASRDDIDGWRGKALAVRVTAAPVEGEANRAVAALLAAALGVRPSAVRVVRGERGRDKMVRVVGLTRQEAHTRLALQESPEAGRTVRRESSFTGREEGKR